MGPVSVAASHQRAALRPAPSASTAPALPALRSPKLLDRLRERIRLLHYSRSTEQAYVYWCRSFIRFHNLRHPMDMGCPEVEAFLGWLATERKAVKAESKVSRSINCTPRSRSAQKCLRFETQADDLAAGLAGLSLG